MSRSNPMISQNPCQRWFEFNGEKGCLKYYSKEQQENIEVDFPFTFLFLDQLSKVGGWNDSAERSIYSNEVKRTGTETLTVRTSGSNIIAQGLYKDIRNDVKAAGGHYLCSIYIAYKEEDELTIGNISLKGAALSAWMDFMKKHQKEVHEGAVKMTLNPEVFKKGSIEYRIPEFKVIPTTTETDEKAIELDKTLQEFFKSKPDYTDTPDFEETERSQDEPPPIEDKDLSEMEAFAEENPDLPF